MREINCHIPITVRITGRLSDAQLDALGETLARSVIARIGAAQQMISSRPRGQPARRAAEILKEGYKAARHDFAGEKYNVPSYQDQGAPTGVVVQKEPDSTAQASSGSIFDRAFEAADQSRWEVVAELINGLSPEHLRYFIGTFKNQSDKIAYIYLGAIGNKRVGKDSAVALATRVAYLDFSFRDQLRRKDWARAAYFLNAFNRSDILLRLKNLDSEKVKAVHEGAIENSEVGEDSGAARVSAEVLAQRSASGDTKALLLPTIRGDDKRALAKVMRVIDGISPSGNPDRPFTIIVDGQPETLMAAQADEIREKAEGVLRGSLNRVKRKADYAENRYKEQNEVDKQHWIVAPIVKTLGGVKDPGPDLLAYVDRANRDIQSSLAAISSHELEKASTFMASAEGAAISASKMWQAYFEGIINAGEMTVTVLEITRDAAFLTLAVLATVATGGAAAGALGAAEGAGATTTILGFEVGTATAANVIATGAPIVANVAEAGAKVSMGDKVDWGALVVDTVVQIIIARFGGRVTGGISKALIGNPATEGLAAKVSERLVHTVILHVGSTALTTAAQDAYRALRGQNVTWQSFVDDLISRLTDPKGIAVALITTALTTAAETAAGRPSRAPSETEGETGGGAERRATIRAKAPKGISEETISMLEKNPELMEALENNPRAARALTLCKSPCIPKFASRKQVEEIEGLIADAERRGLQIDMSRVKEYFHSASNRADLTRAISEFQQAMRKATPSGAAPTGEAIMDEAELLQQRGVRRSPEMQLAAKEGREFDVLEGQKYPHNQVPIRDLGGKVRRLDSYDPQANEIISRKSLATHNGQIAFTSAGEMIDHFQEFALKYPNGVVIADTPAAQKLGLANQTLTGKYILEVPVQEWAIPDLILNEAKIRGITIRDIKGRIYK